MLHRGRIVSLVVVLALAAVAGSLHAASFIVPTDRELIDRASAIVVGTVVSTEGRRVNGRIETIVTIDVSERLKGDVGSVVEVIEPGGQVGDRWALVTAATRYTEGEKILVFLGKRTDGAWGSWGMALGKFSFETRDGIERLVRTPAADIAAFEASGKSAEQPERSHAFVQFIRATAAGRESKIDYMLAPRLENNVHREVEGNFAPGSAYMMIFGGDSYPVRWKNDFTINYQLNQTNEGGVPDTQTRLSNALGAWGSQSAYVGLSNAGVTAVGGGEDGISSIQFDYSGGIPGGESVLAYTWIYGPDTSLTPPDYFIIHAGETYRSIKESDVLLGSGLSGGLFDEALTHELGHSIGFRHSDVAAPSTTRAVMNSVIYGSYGSNLQGWDLDAVQTVYNNGPICRAPQIYNFPSNYSAEYGQQTGVSVDADGTTPFTYQWYEQTSPGVFSPIAGATSDVYIISSLVAPVTLRVTVTNSCGSATSPNVTITPVCNNPVISKQPANQTIASGASATLTVQATGTTPFTYQWYKGSKGTTTAPVGTNSASLNTGPLTVTTKYWVRVTNPCTSVDSNDATVTVSGACVPPVVSTQPQNATAKRGTSFSMTVVATGTAPLTYQWYEGTVNTDETKPVAGATSATLTATATVDKSYWVKVSNGCGFTRSTAAKVTVTCAPPDTFVLSVPGQAQSGQSYPVSWAAAVGAKTYELAELESATLLPSPPDMTGKFVAVTGNSKTFTHPNTTDNARYYYYQARAICDASNSTLSEVVNIGVNPAPKPTNIDLSQPFGPNLTLGVPGGSTGSFAIPLKLLLGGSTKSASQVGPFDGTYTSGSTSTWATVTPASGTVPTAGTNVNVNVNPSGLPPGTSTTTVTVTSTSGGTTSTTNIPVSVNVLSPVSSTPKTTPPQNAMIVPVVGHAEGAKNSQFRSDVRITNASTGTVRYALTYTPSGTDGTKSGKQTQIEMTAGKTVALDDIVKNWYGIGLAGESGVGVLEVRPLNFNGKTADETKAGQYATIVASRTYNLTPQGTFGQFIPGFPFSSFVGKTTDATKPQLISLQQIANSSAYRTNLGLVEGSGSPATVEGRIFNSAGQRVHTFTINLGPAEHQQFALSKYYTPQLPDGRVEFHVTSATGKVTGYASVLDNVTSDPLLVFPVQPTATKGRRWVVPGIADLTNASANWRSDVRIYNPTGARVTANVSFYKQGANPTAVTKQVTIEPQEVEVLNGILRNFLNQPNAGGAIHVTTANDTSLVVTARTYDQRPTGTYGQFIPGVTPAEAIGLNDKPINLLQIEQSVRFRSNLGLAETSGAPVTLEITGYIPEATVAPTKLVTLSPYEFMQIGSIMKDLKLPDTANGRVQIRAVGGTGRATAYISAVDNRTQDPTYVPPQ
ncbi:MAG: Ig-like domain-containing protein [Thermoanaerobaculia bacterium]